MFRDNRSGQECPDYRDTDRQDIPVLPAKKSSEDLLRLT